MSTASWHVGVLKAEHEAAARLLQVHIGRCDHIQWSTWPFAHGNHCFSTKNLDLRFSDLWLSWVPTLIYWWSRVIAIEAKQQLSGSFSILQIAGAFSHPTSSLGIAGISC